MATLTEIAEFVDAVFRLEQETLVQGYSEDGIGPSNQQAQELANRTRWLKDNLSALVKTVDELPDPNAIMKSHLLADDPHEQYLTKERGEANFVKLSTANKPLGYLELDENGLLPELIAKLYEAHYEIVEDKEERLQVEMNKNIIICLQLDENRVYYLNPGYDPSVESNWRKGQSTELNTVVDVFGRIGSIESQYGDYKSNQIETDDDAMFVSKDEKDKWDAKQALLVEGKNIGTVFGQSLISGKDITLSDVENFPSVVSETLEAGEGISIALDDEKGTIKVTNTYIPADNSTPVFYEEDVEAKAKTDYEFTGEAHNYDFRAYALKKTAEIEASTASFNYDNFPTDIPSTPAPTFDYVGYIASSKGAVNYPLTAVTSEYESYISEEVPAPADDTTRIGFNLGGANGLIPPMTGPTTNGWTAYAPYQEEGYEAWKSFQVGNIKGEVPDKDYWCDRRKYNNIGSGTPYVEIRAPYPLTVNTLGFQRYTFFEAKTEGTNTTDAVNITLEGKNSDSSDWRYITSVRDLATDMYGKDGSWHLIPLGKVVTYENYRVKITVVKDNTRVVGLSRVQLFNTVGALVKSAAGNYYTIDDTGDIVGVVPSDDMFTKNNSGGTTTPLPVDKVKDLFPIRFCSDKQTAGVVTEYITKEGIALQYPMDEVSRWNALAGITVSEYYNSTDANSIRAAITLNGTDYLVFKGSQWESIGTLTNDTDSATLLNKKGMLLSNVEKITPTQWSKLFTNAGATYSVGIAYSNTVEKNTDALAPKSIEVSFAELASWQLMSPNDVTIRLRANKIIFKPNTAGSYKFCYKFI